MVPRKREESVSETRWGVGVEEEERGNKMETERWTERWKEVTSGNDDKQWRDERGMTRKEAGKVGK